MSTETDETSEAHQIAQRTRLALWDEPHRGHRYHLMRRMTGTKDTYENTGFGFNSISDAIAHLKEAT